MLTRLNGARFVLNPDLIERVESTPDTVITLVDGKHYLVSESLADVVELVHRARVALLGEIAAAQPQTGPRLVNDTTPDVRQRAEDGAVIPMRRNT
jgi:flagellar protein FlbD